MKTQLRVRSGVSLEVERLAGTSKSNLFLLDVNSDDTGIILHC